MPENNQVCYYCGKNVSQEENASVIDGKLYCPKCAKLLIKEKKDSEMLSKNLYKLCDGDKGTMLSLNLQIKSLKENYGLRSSAISAVLEYIFNSLHVTFIPEYGVETLVIKYYRQAQEFYKTKAYLDNVPNEKILKNINLKTKEIHINKNLIDVNQKKFVNKKKDLKYGPVIDLNSIEDENELEKEEKVEEGNNAKV